MSKLEIEPMPVPFHEDARGGLRIGKSRVLLDAVIRAFRNGDSPETIADSYDTLALADVYAALAYYLAHPEQVDVYLAQRQQEGDELRREIEAHQPNRAEVRRKLMERMAQRERSRAASG